MWFVKGIMMVTWLLLVSLFCKSTQDGQENDVLQCGPQNLTLNSSGQMIFLTWEDTPSCSAVQDQLIYKLLVLIADTQVHDDEVAFTHDQIKSTHSWNWTTFLDLEDVSHAVNISSRYKKHKSPWKQETLPGLKTLIRPQVYPKDKLFKVNSTVSFYCVLPPGEVFNKMYLSGSSSVLQTSTEISNQIHNWTFQLTQESSYSCTNVKCETNTGNENGACVDVGYPPAYTDLQCETQDLKSVECHWIVLGGHTGQNNMSQLLGSPCETLSDGRCTQKVEKVNVGQRNWTFTSQNKFGKVELSDTADLTQRVHMFAPKGVKASTVNARNVSLEWEWTVPQYYNLNITCQVNISHDENTISENFGVGLHFIVLNDLIPSLTYNVTVRCGTTQYFWKWSDWSTNVNFQTKGDVPDALDVWMQMKDNQILIMWKIPLDKKSHGRIKEYEVTWTKITEKQRQNRTKVVFNNHNFSLSLDRTTEYILTVTARNINGSSSPSTITIPSLNPDRKEVNTFRIIGSNGSFILSWSASLTASCGYIVDWCPTSECNIVEWLKVLSNETNARIFSKIFKDGVRYTLSIYACTKGAPLLLERSEGYVREERIQDNRLSLKGKQQDSDYEVSWDPIPLRERTAFIQGYILYCLNNNNNKVINFSTGDSEATSLTARNLKISSYKFTVKAQTAVGECGTSFIFGTLDSLTDNLIMAVFISLVSVFSLLSLITVLCYRHWTCIKQKIYPPIPKPVLTSLGEDGCRPLHVDQCHHSEADIVDDLELHYSAGAPINGYVCQENMPFVFTQTPKGYYNQRLKKCSPPPLTSTTTAIPSESGLLSYPLRSLFPNPSYNLIMEPGDEQSNSGPELQEGKSLERSSDEYQPHGHTETFTINKTEEDPESPMSPLTSCYHSHLPDSCCMHSLV